MAAAPDPRRSHPRVRPSLGQRIEIHIMGDGFLDVLSAYDIGTGGVAVSVPHDFRGCDIDEPVNLIIKLGSDRPFAAQGIIRHLSQNAGGHMFGVQFTSIAPQHVETIRRYVEAVLAERGQTSE
jgi:hypothetical protein